MTPLDAALSYAGHEWRVFPCRDKNHPLVKWRGAASADEHQIREWWRRWPRAAIGLPAGHGFVVLDVDNKRTPTGLDTLDGLGFPFGFETPTVHTPSGGLHAYFRPPAAPIHNTVGGRGCGIGPQLDWRGVGGYVVASSPGYGYRWDTHLGIETPLAEVPSELLPRLAEPVKITEPMRPVTGLDRYAEAALDRACRNIIGASVGSQEVTLTGECFSIGTLASAGGIPAGFARDALQWAALHIPSHDPRRPWREGELERKVESAFAAGVRKPRGARRHG